MKRTGLIFLIAVALMILARLFKVFGEWLS